MTRPAAARYRWQLLRAGPLWLDGGGMFGIIPCVVWNRTTPTDDQGRIELAQNCLLLERVSGLGSGVSSEPSQTRAPRPQTRVLIETGSGNKFDEKRRGLYGLSDRWIGDALREVDVRPDDIGHVIVTHLHFDHAGGLTRRAEGGAAVPTFPNAAVQVQRREWDDALTNRSTMTRTYLRENLDPVRDRVALVDSSQPFGAGVLPDRDALPASALAERATPILPGIDVFIVPGHTWGQQAVRFVDDRGRTIVVAPDVIPTAAHVGPTYNMAFDVDPYLSTINRRWFLKEAAENDWLVVLPHEPGNPCVRARADGKGWYELVKED